MLTWIGYLILRILIRMGDFKCSRPVRSIAKQKDSNREECKDHGNDAAKDPLPA
jgi:hypothetical protein